MLSGNNNSLPTNLNLIYPTSGSALSSIDFPITIEMVSTNPEQIIKIKLMAQKNGDTPILIKTIEPVLNKTIETNWTNKPESGEYKIFGELYDWNGSIKKSNQITVNIN